MIPGSKSTQDFILGNSQPVPTGTGSMTKGMVALPLGFDAGGENCRSLGFARDDKG
jgi:hypothetical protein